MTISELVELFDEIVENPDRFRPLLTVLQIDDVRRTVVEAIEEPSLYRRMQIARRARLAAAEYLGL